MLESLIFLITHTSYITYTYNYETAINNSETVKTVILTIRNVQQHFIRDVRAKFGIPYSPQSPVLGKNQTGVFPISVILINRL